MDFKFYVPNPLSLYRAKTFSTKEPDTLGWIDSLDKSSIMWDIGANIGLYSIYAAKCRNIKVFAFEPSVYNLEFYDHFYFVVVANIVLTLLKM